VHVVAPVVAPVPAAAVLAVPTVAAAAAATAAPAVQVSTCYYKNAITDFMKKCRYL
jgi:hypothetical protein